VNRVPKMDSKLTREGASIATCTAVGGKVVNKQSLRKESSRLGVRLVQRVENEGERRGSRGINARHRVP